MAGTVVVDAVKSSTTGAPTFQNTSGTEIGTLCRAWVDFSGAAGSINASFNVGSVTRNGTGDYTLNFSNAFPDANYSWAGSAKDTDDVGTPPIVVQSSTYTKSTTQLRVRTIVATASNIDSPDVCVCVFR